MDLDDWGTLLTVLLILDLILTGAIFALLAAHRRITEHPVRHTVAGTPRPNEGHPNEGRL